MGHHQSCIWTATMSVTALRAFAPLSRGLLLRSAGVARGFRASGAVAPKNALSVSLKRAQRVGVGAGAIAVVFFGGGSSIGVAMCAGDEGESGAAAVSAAAASAAAAAGDGAFDALDAIFQQALGYLPDDGSFGEVAWGACVGYSAGYTMKQVGKAAAFGVGCVFFLVQGLARLGYVDVKAGKLEKDLTNLLDADGDGKITKEDAIMWFAKLKKMLPSTGGFGAGFAAGIMS